MPTPAPRFVVPAALYPQPCTRSPVPAALYPQSCSPEHGLLTRNPTLDREPFRRPQRDCPAPQLACRTLTTATIISMAATVVMAATAATEATARVWRRGARCASASSLRPA